MTPQNPNFGIKHPIKTIKGTMNDNKRDDDIRNKTMQVEEKDKNGRPTIYTNKKEYEHYGTSKELMDADDAIRRHFRRHPDKLKEDCGIFESVRNYIKNKTKEINSPWLIIFKIQDYSFFLYPHQGKVSDCTNFA